MTEIHDLAAQEYRSLRDAIAARGQTRVVIAMAGLGMWAVVLLATLVWLPYPAAAAVPLTLLVATFEILRPLHAGAERIGRYIQVFYEEARQNASLTPPAWERTAMAFGPTLPGAAGHPLFLAVFLIATAVNLLAVLLPSPLPQELWPMLVPHLLFVVWMVRADRALRAQRGVELARFRELRDKGSP
jgi:hypothetical protein